LVQRRYRVVSEGREYTFTRFDEICARYPDKTAIIYLGERFSYALLRELILRFATGLHNLGVSKGDRVMIYIQNCIQWVITFFGIQRIGAVAVPVAPIYTSHEIEYMVNDSGAETIICQDTKYAFKDIMKSPPTDLKRDLDPWKDLSYILYTGGTTGSPKGVPGNHIGMISYVRDIMDDIVGGHLREGEDSYIVVNPLFHIMALGLFVAVGLNYGNTSILMPVPQVDAILKAIQRYKVRWFLGVPALYRMILENDRLDRYDLSSLRYCYCGGDVLPVEVFNRWKKLFRIPIYQVYGSTEAGHVTYSRLDKEPKLMSVGVPLKSRRCMVVDPDTLKQVPPGETGELLVTSDYTIKGYWERPDETARSYVEIDGKVYYRMGDYVRQDEKGEIYYIERSADIIKCKGYRVAASEVEAVLQDHQTVIGACVVGVPDPKVGERIKAIVVLKEGARGVGAAELTKWCRERLAPYKVPQYIEFRDMLPKSKVGKLLRREIRDEERRRIAKEKKPIRV
jgi:long-chain acyl-CoA synthetase